MNTGLPLSIVLINFNGQRFVQGLVRGLKNQTKTFSELIIIDNGSWDGSDKRLKESFPQCKLHRFSKNQGFSKGMNRGIALSTQPYILLLNNDIILYPDFLAQLYDALDSMPHSGGVMGLLIRPDKVTVDSWGVYLDRKRRRARDYGENLSLSQVTLPKHPFEVFGLNAAAVLFRRELLESVDFEGQVLDEDLFIFFEDVDLAWRARNRGWKFHCVPYARAIHVRGGSGVQRKPWIQARTYANRFLVYLRNESIRSFLSSLPWSIVGECYHLLVKPLGNTTLLKALQIMAMDSPRAWYKRKREKIFHRTAHIPGISAAVINASRMSDSLHSPRVRVIIIHHNVKELLKKCLCSLLPTAPEVDIVVVDNASYDGTQEMMAHHFPRIQYHHNNENIGFARAVNFAIMQSAADYYLIVNSDTLLNPQFPLSFAREFQRHPGLGIMGPRIENPDGSVQISWGAPPRLISEFRKKRQHQRHKKGDVRELERIEREYTRKRIVGWISGACLMIRHSTVQHIGLMDEGFLLYFEDIDWCVRAKEAGWGVLFNPSFTITHVGGASAEQKSSLAARVYRESQKRFYKKHASWIQQVGLWGYFMFRGYRLFDENKFKR